MLFGVVLISCSKDYGENTIEFNGAFEAQKSTKAQSIIEKEEKTFSIKHYDNFDENDLKQMIENIEFFSTLKYPIKNLESFHEFLNEFIDPAMSKSFKRSFTTSDFPINKTQDAFKIYYDRNPLFGYVRTYFPKLPSLSPTLPNFDFNQPGACEIYKRDFSPVAANCGCETYVAALRGGSNNWQAILQGLYAARYYERNMRCR
jgi:hypothetical protein